VLVGLALALSLLLVQPAPDALAATFTVSSTLDEPDASPGDGQCRSAPSSACTLRAAVMEANGQGGSHTITLPAGTFKLTIAGANEDGGATGDLDILANLTIQGAGAGSTIVDGNQLDRVFDVKAGVTSLAISQLTITNGSLEGVLMAGGALTLTGSTVTHNGASGLFAVVVTATNSTISQNGRSGITATSDVSAHSATLVNSTLSGNADWGITDLGYSGQTPANTDGTFTVTGSTVTGNGGGLQGGKITVSNSTVSQNLMQGGGGGIGLFARGDVLVTNGAISQNGGMGIISAFGSVTVRGSQISENTASRGLPFVGAINAATVQVENSIVSKNSGRTHGGILAGTVSLTNSQVVGNTSQSIANTLTSGGVSGTTVTLTNSIVRDNVAPISAGVAGVSITMTNSQLTGNRSTAGSGGGLTIANGVASNGQATVTASTISGNTAADAGGGVYLADGASVVTLTNSTISGNAAANGGGIYQAGAGTLRLTNDTLANNTASTNGSDLYKVNGTVEVKNTIVANGSGNQNCFRTTPLTSEGNNIDSGSSCGFNGPSDQNNTDPKLGPLLGNGGPTQTHALLSGSPAIDRANDTGCPAADQRGIARPQDGDGSPPATCDIGAYEAPANTTPPPSTCSPRPPVQVTTAPDGQGRLGVTVTATGPGRPLRALHVGAASNAQIDAPGADPGAPGPFDVAVPAGSASYTFVVRRVTAGQAVNVPFTVTDACGNWPTFVGGGPSAF